MKTNELMITSNKTYDRVKWFAQIVLPALGTLYFALSQIWGLPAAEEVVGTLVALDAFLGVVLGVSNANYKNSDVRFDGSIDVVETDLKTNVSLNYHDDPYEIGNRDEVLFKVRKQKG